MKTIGVFFVLTVLDLAFLGAHPPPGSRQNPFASYVLVFTIGGLAASLALSKRAREAGARSPHPYRVFLILSLTLSAIEELVAFLTKSGIFQSGHYSLLGGELQAAIPLVMWTIGVLFVLRRYPYSESQIFFLSGLSGWISEVFLNGLFFVSPILALIIFPATWLSYVVLIYLPYRAVQAALHPARRSFWRIPLAIAVPGAMWVIGGILGAVLVHTVGRSAVI